MLDFLKAKKYYKGRRVIQPKLHTDSLFNFQPNIIKTCKYTILSFLPICLFRQFSKVANVFFLIIAIIQSIPSLSPLSPITAILPLVFVIAVSMLREAVEDWRRHQEDDKVNRTKTWVLRDMKRKQGISPVDASPAIWVRTAWQDVQVGDVVKVLQDEMIPADLILLDSSLDGGVAHVMTMNLDGETNLKFRKPVLSSDRPPSGIGSRTNSFSLSTPGSQKPNKKGNDETTGLPLTRYNFHIDADIPRGALDRFDAVLYPGTSSPSLSIDESTQPGNPNPSSPSNRDGTPLSIQNFLPREAMLKSTAWAVGVVGYTGKDSKAILGLQDGKFKMSWIDRATSKMVFAVILFQTSLVIFAGIMSSINTRNHGEDMWYVYPNLRAPNLEGFQNACAFFLLLNTMVPISLLVTMEIVKLLQTYLMELDRKMKYRYLDQNTNQVIEVGQKCRTSSLNEDLGQVGYVFSDKTGTLTSNCLEFRKCWMGGKTLGELQKEDDPKLTQPDIQTRKSNQKNPKSAKSPFAEDPDQPGVVGDTEAVTTSALKPDRRPTTVTPFTSPAKFEESDSSESGAKDEEEEPAPFGEKNSTQKQPQQPIIENDDVGSLIGSVRAEKVQQLFPTIDPLLISKDMANALTDSTKLPNQLSLNSKIKQSPVISDYASLAHQFAILLATCHEVTPDLSNFVAPDYKSITYAGESPDEVCLVETARDFGYVLIGRDGKSVKLIIKGSEKKFEVAYTIPFTNARKRSSVLVREVGTEDYMLYTKGADDTMIPLIENHPDSKFFLSDCQAKLLEFSRAGLRTLVCGARAVAAKDAGEWLKRVKAAECLTDVEKRDMDLKILYNEMEADEVLIGCTATEDKLQEFVPEAIEALRRAKIAVWMITGDKLETAVEIAKSCRLIVHTDVYEIIDEPNSKEKFQALKSRMDAINTRPKAAASDKIDCLVITGRALEIFLSNPTIRTDLREVVMACKTVVCCRTSKDQKAQVVELVKEKAENLTLAIGDGANDVPMIRTAHIGIGVFGKEGRQAVQNSDYAVSRFFHLERLLIFHGRLNYVRIAKLVVYFFFKNVCFTFAQFLYGSANFWSGATFYEAYFITAYNMIFTALPVFALGVLERDASREDKIASLVQKGKEYKVLEGTGSAGGTTDDVLGEKLKYVERGLDASRGETLISASRLRLMAYPRLYYIGQHNTMFSSSTLLTMELTGLAVGSLVYSLSQYGVTASYNGQEPDNWVKSQVTYSCLVFLALAFIMRFSEYISLPMAVTCVYSVIMYISYLFSRNFQTSSEVTGVAVMLYSSPLIYLWIVLILVLVLGTYSAVVATQDRFYPTVRSLWKEVRKRA